MLLLCHYVLYQQQTKTDSGNFKLARLFLHSSYPPFQHTPLISIILPAAFNLSSPASAIRVSTPLSLSLHLVSAYLLLSTYSLLSATLSLSSSAVAFIRSYKATRYSQFTAHFSSPALSFPAFPLLTAHLNLICQSAIAQI